MKCSFTADKQARQGKKQLCPIQQLKPSEQIWKQENKQYSGKHDTTQQINRK